MRHCTFCRQATENAPTVRFYNLADPTEATVETLCDRCEAPRPEPVDYAAPFRDDDTRGERPCMRR
jgi:hypothetical protein